MLSVSVSERCSCQYGQVAVVYSFIPNLMSRNSGELPCTCAIKVIFQHRLCNYFCCVYICQISASGYPKASIDHPQINRYHYNYFLQIMFTSQSRKSRSKKLQSFQSKTQVDTAQKEYFALVVCHWCQQCTSSIIVVR